MVTGFCQAAGAVMVTQHFAGYVNYRAEFVDGVTKVTGTDALLLPYFSGVTFVSGTIGYDTAQPDHDPLPTVGQYHAGSLSIDLAQIGVSVGAAGNGMELFADKSCWCGDWLSAYSPQINSLVGVNALGGHVPMDANIAMNGDEFMLAGDGLPIGQLTNWRRGNVGFAFMDSATGLTHLVILGFTPVPVPEPTSLVFMIGGLLTIGLAARRAKT